MDEIYFRKFKMGKESLPFWIFSSLYFVSQILSTTPFLISEINFGNSQSAEKEQFIEIYNNHHESVNIQSVNVLLMDSTEIYDVIRLPSHYVKGYQRFLIGTNSMRPTPDFVYNELSIRRSSPGAVFLMLFTHYLHIGSSNSDIDHYVSGIYYSQVLPLKHLDQDSLYIHFQPNYLPIPTSGHSLSLCESSIFTIKVTSPTPGAPNLCNSQSQVPGLIINEVNADSTRNDRKEFIELMNAGEYSMVLENYTIVLYDGDSNTAYGVIPLLSASLPRGEYFVIGTNVVNPNQNFEGRSNLNSLQNGADAIALYYGKTIEYSIGMNITQTGLVDAVVYDSEGGHSDILTTLLTPGEVTLHENEREFKQHDESLSRCNGTDPFILGQYKLTRPSPGRINRCDQELASTAPPVSDIPPQDYPDIVINEISLEAGNQYVELYDGGVGGITLDNFMVVFYRARSMSAYSHPVVLNSLKTNREGYRLLRADDDTNGFEEMSTVGCNAIAVHFEHANNINRGSPVTNVNLVDVILYGPQSTRKDNDFVEQLLPGSTPLSVDDILLAGMSYSRCKGWLPFQPASFIIINRQTPSKWNECELPNVVINEFDIQTHSTNERFIEIYADGMYESSLDGIFLVFFHVGDKTAYNVISLDGFSTDERGFCVAGHENQSYTDRPVSDELLQSIDAGSGALGLYLGSSKHFSMIPQQATTNHLLDAIIYGTGAELEELDLLLIAKLLPNQNQINDFSINVSISRCICCTQRYAAAFGNGPPSPGEVNAVCNEDHKSFTESLPVHQSLIRINEVSNGPSGIGIFIELFDEGFGGISTDGLSIGLYAPNIGFYADVSLADYFTDDRGYLTIGTGSAGFSPNLLLHNDITFINGKTNAIILIKNSEDDGFIDDKEISPIDAVVFSEVNSIDFTVIEMFTPGQSIITVPPHHFNSGNKAIVRCFSRKKIDQLAFVLGEASPGDNNTCPLPPLVINEFNVIVFGYDMGEFIEIASPGVSNFPLNNIMVVFYTGTGAVYRVIEITGHKTDDNGLFLMGYSRMKNPRPDMVVFEYNGNYIRNGPAALALHKGVREDFIGGEMSKKGLIHAVVYGLQFHPIAQNLIDILTPGSEQAIEDRSERMDHSINLCMEGNKTKYYSLRGTPKFPNYCPRRENIQVRINEFSLTPSRQFIEIWDSGTGLMSLDNYSIVLADKDGSAYFEIPLSGRQTNSQGYFSIGVAGVTPRPPFYPAFADGFINPDVGAIALYRTSGRSVIDGVFPVSDGLLDAVVYATSDEESPRILTDTLTPNYSAVPSELLEFQSFCRCLSDEVRSPKAFTICPSTPTTMNDCPIYTNDVVINEINVDSDGEDFDTSEFIELYDGGIGNTSLDFLTVVLYDSGFHKSYLSVGLDGYRTNSDGFFVIAQQDMNNSFKHPPDITLSSPPAGFLHDGPDAVTLFRASSTAFPYGSPMTKKSLIDAVVYTTNDRDAREFVDMFTPGYFIIREDPSHLSADESISRCYGTRRRDSTQFGISLPTPGEKNNCSITSQSFQPDIIINELNVDASQHGRTEFLELSDLGRGNTSLDGYTLVFFNGGNRDRSYFEVDLNSKSTNSNGFYVIGANSPEIDADFVVNFNFLQDGPDAVVLYRRSIAELPRGTVATTQGMVDVIVYGTDLDGKSDLVQRLVPGQIQVNENSLHSMGSESLSRCLSNSTNDLSAFVTSYLSPGKPNNCSLHPIFINEINLDVSKNEANFIELYDGGRGNTALDSLVLVLYTEAAGLSSIAYSVLPLQNNRTDRFGYFTIGGSSSAFDLAVESSLFWKVLAKQSGAIALYRGNHLNYQIGMAPTKENLVDAVVIASKHRPASNLLDILLPNQIPLDEEVIYTSVDRSISRCSCCHGLDMSQFAIGIPTPRMTNNCTIIGLNNDSSYVTNHNVVINEVIFYVYAKSVNIFVELRGAQNIRIDDYTIVMYSARNQTAKAYWIVPLIGRSMSKDGLYVIDQEEMNALGWEMHSSGSVGFDGAVALYKGHQGYFEPGMTPISVGLIDALVYASKRERITSLSNVLTPAAHQRFVALDEMQVDTISISRCNCCLTRDNAAFMISKSSPNATNICPSSTFTTTIIINITNADYMSWKSNPSWLRLFRHELVSRINNECKCGFSAPFISDEQIYEGSVIYVATVLSMNKSNSDLLQRSISSVLQYTKRLSFGGQTFTISPCDRQCLDKIHLKAPLTNSGDANNAIVIVVVFVIFVIVSSLFIFLIRKHKERLHTLYLVTFKTRKANEEFFIRAAHNVEQSGAMPYDESFVNPVYDGSVTYNANFPDSDFPPQNVVSAYLKDVSATLELSQPDIDTLVSYT